MPVVGTAAHAKKIDKLVAMVAQCQTFIDRVADPGNEADHIYHPTALVDPRTTPVNWPLAVVMTATDRGAFRYQKLPGSIGNDFRPAGVLVLELCDEDLHAGNLQDSEMEFHNFWGGVLRDLVQLSRLNDNLTITETEMIEFGFSPISQENVAGAYWVTRHTIRYADV